MLEITVWDVQHGSATYIKTPNNRHIVVDLGDNGNDFSPLSALYARGVRQLDVVAVTHPHRDHMDDIYNLALFTVATFTTPRLLNSPELRFVWGDVRSGVDERQNRPGHEVWEGRFDGAT